MGAVIFERNTGTQTPWCGLRASHLWLIWQFCGSARYLVPNGASAPAGRQHSDGRIRYLPFPAKRHWTELSSWCGSFPTVRRSGDRSFRRGSDGRHPHSGYQNRISPMPPVARAPREGFTSSSWERMLNVDFPKRCSIKCPEVPHRASLRYYATTPVPPTRTTRSGSMECPSPILDVRFRVADGMLTVIEVNPLKK